MKKTKIGIIGMGNMGTSHAGRIIAGEVPHMELGAVCDIDPAKKALCDEKYPGIPFFGTAEEMMKSGLVDSVLIAVPHYDHSPLAILAFQHGLHVYCEKPAGVYTKQVIDMIEASKKRPDLVFSMGFQQRTLPTFQKLRSIVNSGELGTIKKVIWIVTDWYRPQAYHDSSSWRSTWKGEGGGTIANQNPHNIDLFQWIFGMPDEVLCTIGYGKYYNIEVDDEVTAIFRYKNGMVGIYTTSTGEQPGTNRLEISCDMGKLVLEKGKLTFWKNKVSEREFNRTNTKPFGHIENEMIEVDIPKTDMQQHNALLENFALAILEGQKLIAPGVEGINEITLADCFYYSDWQGQKWIRPAEFDHEGFYQALQDKIRSSTYVKKVTATEAADMNSSFQK